MQPNLFGYYVICSTIVTVVALLKLPSKGMNPIDNLGGSFVAALAFGWLIWPLAVLAAYKVQKHGRYSVDKQTSARG